MLKIDCIENESDFLLLQDEWEELWKRSLTSSFFMAHSWIRSCWPEIGAGKEMRVYVLRDHGRPVLIAPLMKSRIRQTSLRANCLSFIEHPETQIADFLIGKSQSVPDVFANLLTFLRQERSTDWDYMSLDKLRSQSLTLQGLVESAQAASYRFEVVRSHEAPFISLEGTWGDYWGSRSARQRKTLRNISNRIERLGMAEVRQYAGRDSAKEALQKLFTISGGSWKAAEGIAITSRNGRMRFFEDLAAVAGEKLKLWFLEINGRAIASEIQVVDADVIYALRSDYDERYADSSPGTYLQLEILKNLFAGRFREYNLGVGLNAYKLYWADQRSVLKNFRLYNKTFYGRLLYSIDQYRVSKLKQMPVLRTLHGFFRRRDS